MLSSILFAAPLAAIHSSIISTFLNPTDLLHAAGPWAIAVIMLIVFIETGLLFPFLPGDSLVFTAALLTASLGVPLPVLALLVAVAAIAGDQVGYLIGRRLGNRIFSPHARIFKTQYRDRASAFFERYGAASLVLARFVPVVRTYVPPVVGSSTLRYRVFLLWNVLGGISWSLVLCIAGYFLGKIPVVADNVELFAIGIVVLSIIPIAVSLIRRRSQTT
jgi:membrane-associated protein